MAGRPPSRRSSGLNRERIVATAVELADSDGLAALSMARLAERLGCGTMSLYRHVANKDELVTFMLSTAPGPPPRRAEGADWSGALVGLGRRTVGCLPPPSVGAADRVGRTARGSRANWRGWMPGSPRSPIPGWPSATSWPPSWRCCTSSAARRPSRSRPATSTVPTIPVCSDGSSTPTGSPPWRRPSRRGCSTTPTTITSPSSGPGWRSCSTASPPELRRRLSPP